MHLAVERWRRLDRHVNAVATSWYGARSIGNWGRQV